MQEITVGLGEREYPIMIDSHWATDFGPVAYDALEACDRILVVTNNDVAPLYGDRILTSLRGVGFDAHILVLPEGEDQKTPQTTSKVWDYLIAHDFTRQSALVALGGGVIGDITGFAAATYMRGIRFIQVPTSLLAMVDSSVGGKTGVNHPLAKNIIGAFWQPRLVFIDTEFLKSLPHAEFRSGYAEVIKHGVIRDPEYFQYLEKDHDNIFALDHNALQHIVKGSCEIKSAVVAEDEREGGLRAILNFGHTVGHAVEALAGYGNVRHGEAVAIGMDAAVRVAEKIELLDDENLKTRLDGLIKRAELPTTIPKDLTIEQILHKMMNDKKVRDGRMHFILPEHLGSVVIRNDIGQDILIQTLCEMGAKQ